MRYLCIHVEAYCKNKAGGRRGENMRNAALRLKSHEAVTPSLPVQTKQTAAAMRKKYTAPDIR